ncbi:MAG: hypothetical protein AB7F32_06600 [Victivallaceae bacterium]
MKVYPLLLLSCVIAIGLPVLAGESPASAPARPASGASRRTRTPLNPEAETFLKSARAYEKNQEFQKALNALDSAIALMAEAQRSGYQGYRLSLEQKMRDQREGQALEEQACLWMIGSCIADLTFDAALTSADTFLKNNPDSVKVKAAAERCRRLLDAPENTLTPVERQLRLASEARVKRDADGVRRAVEAAVKLAPDDRELRLIEWEVCWKKRFPMFKPARLDDVAEAIAFIEKYDLPIPAAFHFARPPMPPSLMLVNNNTAIEKETDARTLREGREIAGLQRKYLERRLDRMPGASLREVTVRLRDCDFYFNGSLYYDEADWRAGTTAGVAKAIQVLEAYQIGETDSLSGTYQLFRNNVNAVLFNGNLLFLHREAYYRNLDAALASKSPLVRSAALFWQLLKQLEADPQMTPEQEEKLIFAYLEGCEEISRTSGVKDLQVPNMVSDPLPGRDLGVKISNASRKVRKPKTSPGTSFPF